MKNKLNIAILGIGLIGGSIALGLKKRLDNRVSIIGMSQNINRAFKAKSLGMVDQVIPSMKEIPKNIDLVIISTPISVCINLLKRIGRNVRTDLIIIDTCSTKKTVVDTAEKCLPEYISFIGTHPMAGIEKQGFEFACPDLFINKPWIICPSRNSKKNDLSMVNDIINILEAKAVILDPVSHDKLSVLSSHLPLILGNILIGTILREHQWHNVEKIISTGFMDTTRLASDNPLLKSDIIRTNSQNIIDSLNKYKQELDYFIKLVQSDNRRKILSYLKNSKLRRDKLLSCN